MMDLQTKMDTWINSIIQNTMEANVHNPNAQKDANDNDDDNKNMQQQPIQMPWNTWKEQ